jgi:plastocyanin
MSKKTTVITVVVAAALLLIVAVIALNTPNRQAADTTVDTTSTSQQTPASSDTEPTNDEEQAVAATITYTDSGFEPSSLTVKSGDAIRVENKSSRSLSFNSDDHPSHTEQGELNVGNVSPGSSRVFTVTTKGTWGFHNHDNASHTGSLRVE